MGRYGVVLCGTSSYNCHWQQGSEDVWEEYEHTSKPLKVDEVKEFVRQILEVQSESLWTCLQC